jgi:hypothetical protein
VKWWQPRLDADPGRSLRAVARHGEDPEPRRALRVDGGWIEVGPLVDFYADRTPPMTWARVGMCWAEMSHPVVEVREVDGRWAVFD